MTTKRGGKVGGMLIPAHPSRLLHAVAFQQIAARQRKATVAKVIEERAAVALTELAAQAAWAHCGKGCQLRESMIPFRRLFQQAPHAFKTRMLRPARARLLALVEAMAEQLIHQPLQQQLA